MPCRVDNPFKDPTMSCCSLHRNVPATEPHPDFLVPTPSRTMLPLDPELLIYDYQELLLIFGLDHTGGCQPEKKDTILLRR